MRPRKLSPATILVLAAIALVAFALVPRAAAQTETLLHSFNAPGAAGGLYPNGGLITDSAGNIYGTTAADGNGCSNSGCGTVFELIPGSGGTYTEKVLHAFSRTGKNAWNPQAGLVMDAGGNLYGTTYAGGAYGQGAAFEVSPASGGSWTYSVIHSFGASSSDGTLPRAALTVDRSGNVYGTTSGGGTHGVGTIFEISPIAGGGWTKQTLLNFNSTNGAYPFSQLLLDSAGNLFGTTTSGGNTPQSGGTAFELSPKSGGGWTLKVLYNFTVPPSSGLIEDASGNLYGSAAVGGASGAGAVFELSVSPAGTWSQSLIYSFCSLADCADGAGPANGVVFDSAGNLYGTTINDGTYGTGTAFELSPATGGTWTISVLHSFGNNTDGAYPEGVVFNSTGKLLGATVNGGRHGYGTVFQITP